MKTDETIANLKARIAELEQDDRAKSEFLSMVIHQLRTPLTGTKWTFDMLLNEDIAPLTPEQMRIISEAAKSNARIMRLLEEMSVANQTENWEFQYTNKPTNIEDLIEEKITEFLADAKSRNVHLIFKRPKQDLPTLSLDPDKVGIIFENLIDNAIKYSDSGGTVTITIHHPNDHVDVSVHNAGITIPAEQQNQIFQKYFRADSAKQSGQKGTGLGLFTALTIARNHGGGISFVSNSDQGTTFTLTMPFNKH